MFDYSEKYIHRVENFMGSDDQQYLLSYLESMQIERSDAQKQVKFLEELGDKKAENIIKEYEKRTYLEILGNYSNKIDVRIEHIAWMRRLELVKWNYNKVLDPHRDGHISAPPPPELSLSTLIYLNDDYMGGEISFPEYGLSIKPKAAELIIFPSHFLHEVKATQELLGGKERCTLPMFYSFQARKFGEFTHPSYLEQIEEFENQKGEYFYQGETERKVVR
jgi:hypothetical protein